MGDPPGDPLGILQGILGRDSPGGSFGGSSRKCSRGSSGGSSRALLGGVSEGSLGEAPGGTSFFVSAYPQSPSHPGGVGTG